MCELLNEHEGLVGRNLCQLRCSNLAERKLVLKDEQPVVYRPYRLSHHERQKVRYLVEELKGTDIIEDSNASYASPILLVKKKTGDIQMCVDYRKLNKKNFSGQVSATTDR